MIYYILHACIDCIDRHIYIYIHLFVHLVNIGISDWCNSCSLARPVALTATRNVKIWAVTVQNEPEHNAPWEACCYTAKESWPSCTWKPFCRVFFDTWSLRFDQFTAPGPQWRYSKRIYSKLSLGAPSSLRKVFGNHGYARLRKKLNLWRCIWVPPCDPYTQMFKFSSMTTTRWGRAF